MIYDAGNSLENAQQGCPLSLPLPYSALSHPVYRSISTKLRRQRFVYRDSNNKNIIIISTIIIIRKQTKKVYTQAVT